MQLGIDVGGTNTDAVLIFMGAVYASIKTPTTADIGRGIVTAIREVLVVADATYDQIDTVVIGTTQFTNAFVERRHLNPVGVLRLCLPSAEDIAPMLNWPDDLRGAVGDNVYLLPGGYEFDGRAISPFDEMAVAEAVKTIKSRGITSFAVSSVCSPVNAAMEKRAAEIILNEVPDSSISLSNELGGIGLIERENAAIMNASLATLSKYVIGAIRKALKSLNIAAPFYISQNDGTLMSAEQVECSPVLTFSSGPTNSMRGASYLSGVSDGIVVDVGGTTTDVGALVNGYPRESSVAVDIGGVRTNFRMPDVVSVGLGGGSVIVNNPELTIGPKSVGFNLTKEALVFGGNTLTATDVVVAAGLADIGDRSQVKHLSPTFIKSALSNMHKTMERAIDTIKTTVGDTPVILVGGGAVLASGDFRGAESIILPEHSAAANAVGAAIAQVGGDIDELVSYQKVTRSDAIEAAKLKSIDRVVENGGCRSTAEIVEIEEVPVAYSGNNSVRIRVKAVANLLHNS